MPVVLHSTSNVTSAVALGRTMIDIRSDPVTVQFMAGTFSVSVCEPALSPKIVAWLVPKANVRVKESRMSVYVDSLGSPPVIRTDAWMPPVWGAVDASLHAVPNRMKTSVAAALASDNRRWNRVIRITGRSQMRCSNRRATTRRGGHLE